MGTNGKKAADAMAYKAKDPIEEMGHVLVLGLGVSGKAVVEYLAPLIGSRVTTLTVMCGPSNPAALQWVEGFLDGYGEAGGDPSLLTFSFDVEDASELIPEGAPRFDLCIASPGISAFSPMYESGRDASAKLIGEVELAWRESASDSRWVAITGTNGKTTTTSLIEHLLREGGMDANAVGNIGDACIAQVARDNAMAPMRGDAPVYVVEVSSFQLASIDALVPEAAVMLGIKPDHVEWHKSYEHYVASKMRLIDNMVASGKGTAVMDATNEEVRSRIGAMAPLDDGSLTVVAIGSEDGLSIEGSEASIDVDGHAGIDGHGRLAVSIDGDTHVLCDASDLAIKGPHNQVNSLAAASAAIAMGVDDSDVEAGLLSFSPLEHRIEPVATVDGIRYFNDSKATNVDSAVCAIRSFSDDPLVVMLGGHDKMTDLGDLVEACRAHADAAVCYGEAGERFEGELSLLDGDSATIVREPGMAQAFERASAIARGLVQDGQEYPVVLLSPACSSYDEFRSFEERGRTFKDMVASLERELGANDAMASGALAGRKAKSAPDSEEERPAS